ncbi:Four helix bundle protein [Desulfonema limicola]|uniref:Four helix bundle protein n=1 Tax=Desulfonema limicola TaxID=45656 RepID=A0A975BBE6_9BACT|nr:four helix bundle protein [Desulfonema limicola]QTA82266.1 Four helix bundle protein [Desulfonema limicola]
MRKNNLILDKSFDFAVRIVNLNKHLVFEKKEYVLSKQILRSGTAIGALVREAQHAESPADFIHKFSIALKEANETEYWLLLLYETNYLNKNQFDSLKNDIEELLKILVTIVKNTKQKTRNRHENKNTKQ